MHESNALQSDPQATRLVRRNLTPRPRPPHRADQRGAGVGCGRGSFSVFVGTNGVARNPAALRFCIYVYVYVYYIYILNYTPPPPPPLRAAAPQLPIDTVFRYTRWAQGACKAAQTQGCAGGSWKSRSTMLSATKPKRAKHTPKLAQSN